MKEKPVLVVLAAGMGSRYGGLKQMDAMGSCGRAILDYSLYDAYGAGFRTAVILIKKAIEKEFMEAVGARLAQCPMEIRYAFQEIDDLPEGYTPPEGRTKPWGTGHAVLCGGAAAEGAPFAVINADDYYGKHAFSVIYDALCRAEDGACYDYCMVGYEVCKTITENGTVSRGVCRVDGDGYLLGVTEHTGIADSPAGIRGIPDGKTDPVPLAPDTPVSMNLWGFTSSILPEAQAHFRAFLDTALRENPMKGEFYLPFLVDSLIREGKARVRVLRSPDRWYGVTYAADKPGVMEALRILTDEGAYPSTPWVK